MGHDYWADISSTGAATIPNVVPGTYRVSVYVLGQWGEYRQDGVVITAGNTTSVGTYTLTPNGANSLAWTNTTGNASDSSERSGLSGFTEWVAFQWPTSALKPDGQDNVITISVSDTSHAQTEGGKVQTVANNSDDALRLELSSTGANPTFTGWHGYEFVTSGIDTPANDTVPNP